ncbi:endocytosis defective- protein [Dispira parvispora]|uniref:Endocytosis defective- protein n=1 Tax=Dispira parvispora TaxID=1520584 RepID=A0A9W8E8N0_9FUNG|nr:endocytosis defective- protein [Dispira parvispora]
MQLTPSEQAQYHSIFQNAGPVNGILSGENARAILVQSNLPFQHLEKVWNLSDMDQDGGLDFDEFCVAMKLVYSLLGGQLTQLPTQLPASMIPPSKTRLGSSGVMPSPSSHTEGGYNMSSPRPQLGTMDWYIPPMERNSYENQFNQLNQGGDTVSMLYLNDFLRGLGLPWDQVRQCWNLVDVRKSQVLNKEQFILLLHVVQSVLKGHPMPRSLPGSVDMIIKDSLKLADSLRFTSIPAAQSNVGGSGRSTGSGSHGTGSPGLFGKNSRNVALADSYIAKLNSNYTAKSTYPSSSTKDNSSAATILKEEQRLREELKSLESEVNRLEAELETHTSATSTKSTSLVQEELEGFLQYAQTRDEEIVASPYKLRDQIRQREGELQRHHSVVREIEEGVASLTADKDFISQYLREGRSKLDKLQA